MEIKSKPTVYDGYEFRSRIEARWAVFFDAMGIKYHYEYQDFILPDGTRYLPDFFLPGYGYAEVKPDGGFTDEAKKKCEQLCLLIKENILMLEGVPDFRSFQFYGCDYDPAECGTLEGVIFGHGKYSGRIYTYPEWTDKDGFFKDEDVMDSTFNDAVYKSRAAKFEFNYNTH